MLTFLFPGQGSQQPGMGAAFADDPAWSVVEQASDATGRDVAHLLLDADADELVETRNAQLGTFVHSMVVLEALRSRDLRPAAVAGHSLGELSALCAAGVLGFDDAVRLVAERGEAMQVCCTQRKGTMAAVLGLDEPQVTEVCAAVDGDVWVANSNAPGQVVIAGDPAAIDAATAVAKEAGAKRVMPLDVSGAFHTPFMAPAGERLGAAIADATFHDAGVPVAANVDGAIHTDAGEWPVLLERQLTSPVRWTGCVEALLAAGATTFVEVGPGAVLTGTIKRIDKGTARHSVMTPDQLDAVVAAIGADA
ncbi:ACP S-malonyltransferase [Acidimicrobiia bacterium EGI L10123]|uniref:ACP S-malonyltransferase n=1 Tax=Salinilacustrithrix flava TaxID=2957203 RepID=UPI003D7C247F|nr:ACP S-malonyltransferase [Acidimicrobiia bacterium EGI L10123]